MGLPENTNDRFRGQYMDGQKAGEVTGPAIRGAAVTPSDSTDLTFVTRGLWVGVAGDVVVDMAESGTVTLAGVAAGTLLPVRVKRVRATGTTASSIVALD